jgi:hypothetical protein
MTTTNITPSGVLSVLVTEDRPWHVDELARAMGARLATLDSLAELNAVGLAHWLTPEFVLASRAALHADRIEQGGDV